MNLYNLLTTRSISVKLRVKEIPVESHLLISDTNKEIYDFYQMNSQKKVSKE